MAEVWDFDLVIGERSGFERFYAIVELPKLVLAKCHVLFDTIETIMYFVTELMELVELMQGKKIVLKEQQEFHWCAVIRTSIGAT